MLPTNGIVTCNLKWHNHRINDKTGKWYKYNQSKPRPFEINVREYRRGNHNGQNRETGNIWYTRRRKAKQKTIWIGHRYIQTNTNNLNKTWAHALIQTTGGKDEHFNSFILICIFVYLTVWILHWCQGLMDWFPDLMQ